MIDDSPIATPVPLCTWSLRGTHPFYSSRNRIDFAFSRTCPLVVKGIIRHYCPSCCPTSVLDLAWRPLCHNKIRRNVTTWNSRNQWRFAGDWHFPHKRRNLIKSRILTSPNDRAVREYEAEYFSEHLDSYFHAGYVSLEFIFVRLRSFNCVTALAIKSRW